MVARATSNETAIAAQAPSRIPVQSRLPKARPARTVAAFERPIWIMKVSDEICSAMPCAASARSPSQPIMTDEAENSPTSASVVIPIGTPR